MHQAPASDGIGPSAVGAWIRRDDDDERLPSLPSHRPKAAGSQAPERATPRRRCDDAPARTHGSRFDRDRTSLRPSAAQPVPSEPTGRETAPKEPASPAQSSGTTDPPMPHSRGRAPHRKTESLGVSQRPPGYLACTANVVVPRIETKTECGVPLVIEPGIVTLLLHPSQPKFTIDSRFRTCVASSDRWNTHPRFRSWCDAPPHG